MSQSTTRCGSGGGATPQMSQVEIPIPAQPPRITLGAARAMRDSLEKQLAGEKPRLADQVTAIALQFSGAYSIYRRIRREFYRKRSLDALHTVSCFISALERKR